MESVGIRWNPLESIGGSKLSSGHDQISMQTAAGIQIATPLAKVFHASFRDYIHTVLYSDRTVHRFCKTTRSANDDLRLQVRLWFAKR